MHLWFLTLSRWAWPFLSTASSLPRAPLVAWLCGVAQPPTYGWMVNPYLLDFFPGLPASSCKFSMFQILGGVYVGMVTIINTCKSSLFQRYVIWVNTLLWAYHGVITLSSGGCHFWSDGITKLCWCWTWSVQTFPSFLAKFARYLFAVEVSSSMENKGDFIELYFSIPDPCLYPRLLRRLVPFGWLWATWATSAEAFRSSSSFGLSSWLSPFVLAGMIQ